MHRKVKYSVDFPAYMAECESNYWRILKLIALNDEQASYAVQMPAGYVAKLILSITERCKYTTMVSVEQMMGEGWLGSIRFDVRLYHDAKMAEVFSFQGCRRVLNQNTYPNKDMMQRDEKFQQHRFLSECLINCLKNGLSESTVLAI